MKNKIITTILSCLFAAGVFAQIDNITVSTTAVNAIDTVEYDDFFIQIIQYDKNGNIIQVRNDILEILPVELIDFEATPDANGRKTLCTWATATEKNVREFVVERSTNGIHWKDVGQVAAIGESTTRQEYQYTDAQPLCGTNIYRLRIIDNDGTTQYSNKEIVDIEGCSMSIFPNPSQQNDVVKMVITGDFANVIITATDITGRIVHSVPVGQVNGVTEIPLDLNLSAGTYFIKAETEGYVFATHKHIVSSN
mgnify:CR=1 FL=1